MLTLEIVLQGVAVTGAGPVADEALDGAGAGGGDGGDVIAVAEIGLAVAPFGRGIVVQSDVEHAGIAVSMACLPSKSILALERGGVVNRAEPAEIVGPALGCGCGVVFDGRVKLPIRGVKTGLAQRCCCAGTTVIALAVHQRHGGYAGSGVLEAAHIDGAASATVLRVCSALCNRVGQHAVVVVFTAARGVR